MAKIIDEDTVDGFAPWTVFMICNKRSDLWHVAKTQSMGALIVSDETLCGIKPYKQHAESKNNWESIEQIKVCQTCKSMVGKF